MQASPTSIKNEPIALNLKSGKTTVMQPPKNDDSKKNRPFSFVKTAVDLSDIKFMSIFSIKTYSIIIFTLSCLFYILQRKIHLQIQEKGKNKALLRIFCQN